jgi:preprotein translocase subunit SecD
MAAASCPRPLIVAVDGQAISQATIRSVLSGQIRITGLASSQAAAHLAASLNAGSLPLPITVVDATPGPCQ